MKIELKTASHEKNGIAFIAIVDNETVYKGYRTTIAPTYNYCEKQAASYGVLKALGLGADEIVLHTNSYLIKKMNLDKTMSGVLKCKLALSEEFIEVRQLAELAAEQNGYQEFCMQESLLD